MAKRFDITDKLGLAPKPVLVIKGIELEINNSAPNVIQLMSLVDNTEGISASTLVGAADILFDKKNKAALDKLDLSFEDYTIVMSEALGLAVGETPEGEAPTLAMT